VWGSAEFSLQALMESSPGESAGLSTEEMLPLREAIQDAIDRLPELERLVFDGYFVGRYTMREMAAELGIGKSTVHRLKDKAVSALAAMLGENELVKGMIA
jgi:RNA polymerase sigma factor (sigma-70 family)